MNYHQHITQIASELHLDSLQVSRTSELLQRGATVPFIARYRKELTGSLNEQQISLIRDRKAQLEELDKRRASILESIREQGKLSPELELSIINARKMAELEDLYLPFRPKRKTRATIAISKGLEPLAQRIFAQPSLNPEKVAIEFVDKEKGVETIEEALAGARDIIAEWVNEDSAARGRLRRLFEKEATISSNVAKGKEAEGHKYETYFEWAEKISKAPSHRILAMFRGETEGYLKLDIEPEKETALEILYRQFVKGNSLASQQVALAVEDSYKRLLGPSMETEIRNLLKENADREAIRVFAENLRQLLLAPPLGQKRVLAIDPGFRTGCKVVCLDREGNLVHNETIFPHPPQNQRREASAKIVNLVNAYKIEAIAVGNGTAGRETEQFIRQIRFNTPVLAVMVNESGASVYSASAVAREEFPDYDVTVRGAVSIGRRLADPLAELVKIDPKSIGVGQYQHDVDQKLLKQSLDDVVESAVNAVGVEINTASKELLSYVSGVGPSLASAIVKFRGENGPFMSRKALRKVPRFGEKVFEQAAGFIRVNQSENPLDKSAVHPENYNLVQKMAYDLGKDLVTLMKDASLQKQIKLENYIDDKIGLPTLKDILQELAKPGRDPRQKFDVFEFDQSVNSIEDLREGMILPGIVTNITAFGVFVDVGVHQDGLVHISQLANSFVSDPAEVVKLNQKVVVKVQQIDVHRKRINLSIKEADQNTT
ncbi:MAG TPA: Tex family protein [Bacteroidales bacterium]|nr:Tex family protein [Bacteroidales bacterium]